MATYNGDTLKKFIGLSCKMKSGSIQRGEEWLYQKMILKMTGLMMLSVVH